MSEYVNLVKLSVGSQTVSDLIAWQNNPRAQGAEGCPRHVTVSYTHLRAHET